MLQVKCSEQTEAYQISDARRGSEALLSSLIRHHDYNISPPKGWKARVVKLKPPPLEFPHPKPIWFSIEEPEDKRVKIADIRRALCTYFKVTNTKLGSQRKTADVAYPRQIGYFLAELYSDMSASEVARRFGRGDHSTVLYGTKKIERLVRSDWTVAYDVAHVEALL